MITIDEAKEISIRTEYNLTDIEMLQVIERFIYDKKNVIVGTMIRPNNKPHLEMMVIAFNASAEYYGKLK